MAKRKAAPKRKTAATARKAPVDKSMPKHSMLILVPEPERGAYNPSRAAGKLLLSQTQHLREALVQHRKELDAALAVDPATLRTEGQVSSYIHRATALLHTHGPKAAGK